MKRRRASQYAQLLVRPAQLPPQRNDFVSDKHHMAALIDHSWVSLAFFAVHGSDPDDAERMRVRVLAERDDGRPLHPAAVAWQCYVLDNIKEVPRESGGRGINRARRRAQEELLGKWLFENGHEPLVVELFTRGGPAVRLPTKIEKLAESKLGIPVRTVFARGHITITLGILRISQNRK